MVFDNFFKWLFGPIINNLSPFWSVLTISFLITLSITLAYKYLTNQKEIKRLKDSSKELRKQMKLAKDDRDKLMSLQKESMSKSIEMMKHTMKPTIYYMIPLLLVFSWLSKTFKGTGDILVWGTSVPLFGTGLGWFGVYLLTALILNGVIRKALKVH
jgi:uncharacterized membrane protein (DUF106 family)